MDLCCTSCETLLPESAKFCGQCGTKVLRAAEVLSQAAPPVEPHIPSNEPVLDAESQVAVPPRPRIGRAVRGLVVGTVVMLGALIFVVNIPTGTEEPAQVATSAPAASVGAAAPTCGAALDVLKYATVQEGVQLTDAERCTIANAIEARKASTAKEEVRELCDIAKVAFQQTYGTTDPAEMKRIISTEMDPNDPETRRIVAPAVACIAPERSIQAIVKKTTETVVSVGKIELHGSICTAYLVEHLGELQGLETNYFDLQGIGECAGKQLQFNNAFHPENDPQGALLGNLMVSEYHYGGRLPQEWIYKGKQYPFYVEADEDLGDEIAAASAKAFSAEVP